MKNELIPTNTERWLVRESVKRNFNQRNELNDDRLIAELVYGHHDTVKVHDATVTIVVGQVFHTLHDPTAAKSITEMAESLNARGYVPDGKATPKQKPAKTRLDGFRQSFAQAGGDALFPADVLKATISYDPHK